MPVYVPPYLTPTSSAPAEGADLEDVLHDVIAGITALDPTLVRPRWQPEPPDIPAEATAWCAFGFQEHSTSEFPQVTHNGADGGSDTLQQHETLEVRASFYDLGAGGEADAYAAKLRDGLYIAQNREAMFDQAGIMLIATGSVQPAPVLFKERWLYRADFTFTIRRQIDRTYGVPNINSAEGTIESQAGHETPVETPFVITPEP